MTRFRQVLEWLALGFLLAFLGVSLWVDSGRDFIPLPALTWAGPLVCAIIILLIAWPVRSMSKGDRGEMSPLLAARVAVFCQACTRGGALIGGLCLGTWASLTGFHGDYLAHQADRALWAAIASLLLSGAGWLGEYWCSIDDDDDESEGVAEGAA